MTKLFKISLAVLAVLATVSTAHAGGCNTSFIDQVIEESQENG